MIEKAVDVARTDRVNQIDIGRRQLILFKQLDRWEMAQNDACRDQIVQNQSLVVPLMCMAFLKCKHEAILSLWVNVCQSDISFGRTAP